MTPRAQEFLQRLEDLKPDGNDHLEYGLYQITEPLASDPNVPELLEAMFRFMEAHPHADYGIPGPLVHVIERYPGIYESLLEESLARAPMSTTVHMVNRQLNADLSADERRRWTGIMEGIARNTELPWEICDQAEEFLNYQRSKS